MGENRNNYFSEVYNDLFLIYTAKIIFIALIGLTTFVLVLWVLKTDALVYGLTTFVLCMWPKCLVPWLLGGSAMELFLLSAEDSFIQAKTQ